MTKRNIFISIAIFLSVAIGFLVASQPALAANCGGVKTSIIDCGGKEGEAAIFDIIKLVIKIMTGAIGIVAVGAIIYGAILFSTSGDNPEGLKKAKSIWVNVIIGLLLFAFMVAITNFIIPGGAF